MCQKEKKEKRKKDDVQSGSEADSSVFLSFHIQSCFCALKATGWNENGTTQRFPRELAFVF